MKQGVIILFCILMLTSCDGIKYGRSQEFYNNIRKELPDSLFNNFPKKVSSTYVPFCLIWPASLVNNGSYCGIFIKQNVDDSDFDSEYKKLLNKAVYVTHWGDSCVVGIKEWRSDNKIKKTRLSCSKKLYIVPEYLDETNPFNKWSPGLDISSSAEILVQSCSPGRYLPDEYLLDNDFLPEGYSHGYSKGMIIDKSQKLITHWLIVW